MAIRYHKTVEGEYGCPGASCPGVQRILTLLLEAAAAALSGASSPLVEAVKRLPVTDMDGDDLVDLHEVLALLAGASSPNVARCERCGAEYDRAGGSCVNTVRRADGALVSCGWAIVPAPPLASSPEQEQPVLAMPPTLAPALPTTTESYYDPVPTTDSPLRHAYTLDLAQLKESRGQWKAEAESLRAEVASLSAALEALHGMAAAERDEWQRDNASLSTALQQAQEERDDREARWLNACGEWRTCERDIEDLRAEVARLTGEQGEA